MWIFVAGQLIGYFTKKTIYAWMISVFDGPKVEDNPVTL